MAAHEQGGGRAYDRFYPISIAIVYHKLAMVLLKPMNSSLMNPL